MKTRTLVLPVCMLLCLVLLLFASCVEQEEPPVVYTHVCGDGVCSSEEINICDIDCSISANTKPDIPDRPDEQNQQNQQEQQYQPRNQINYSAQNLGQENIAIQNDEKIYVESFESYIPEKGFRVANSYNILNLGEDVSDVMGVLHKYLLREVLRSGRLSSNTEAFGPRASMYEQFLQLRQGKVVFGYDEDEEVISTYLLFEEEEPIFEYQMELYGGIFKFFEGEVIHFLGHDYFIEEVNPDSIKLVGVTTPDTLLFRDGHSAWINGKTVSSEILNVTFEENRLRIVINAPEEIKILPGTNLLSYLKNPEILLTNRIDIAYEGLTDSPVHEIKFNKMSNQYKLMFTTNKNISYDIPLVYFSPFKTGNEKYDLIWKEGESKDDYFISKKDYILINNNMEFYGMTHVLQLINVKEEDHILVFQDPAYEEFVIYFEGTPGEDASANLVIDNVLHKVYVGNDDTISVDLDGNGRIGSDEVPIVTAGNGIIKINKMTDSEMELSLITKGVMRENSNDDLVIRMKIDSQGLIVNHRDIEMFPETDSDSETLIGLNDYGTVFILQDYIDEQEQKGNDLLIHYPIVQRFADVIVKGYE